MHARDMGRFINADRSESEKNSIPIPTLTLALALTLTPPRISIVSPPAHPQPRRHAGTLPAPGHDRPAREIPSVLKNFPPIRSSQLRNHRPNAIARVM